MNSTWIDVADTAVKIGCGSLITGFITYKLAKFTHRSETAKLRVAHDRELLELCTEAFEDFSAEAMKYWALTVELSRHFTNKQEIDQERFDLATKQCYILFDKLSESLKHESKLSLIGAHECKLAIQEFQRYISKFSDHGPGKHARSSEFDLQNISKEISRLRANVYKALEARYSLIHT